MLRKLVHQFVLSIREPQDYEQMIKEIKEDTLEQHKQLDISFVDHVTFPLLLSGASLFEAGCFAVAESGAIVVLVNKMVFTDSRLEVVILAHELGHLADYVSKKMDDERWIYLNTHFKVDVEIQAWRNAVEVLRRKGYRDWNLFLTIAKRSLDSYYDNAKVEGVRTKEPLKEVMRSIKQQIKDFSKERGQHEVLQG